MALPTVFQMLWGRSTVHIAFTTKQLQNNFSLSVLWCELTNPPIKCWFLQKLGVQRMPAEDIVAHYQIRDAANNNLVFQPNLYVSEVQGDFSKSLRGRIPPSKTPYRFPIVTFNITTRQVFVVSENNVQQIIPPGAYKVIITVTNEGRKEYHVERTMVVQDRDPYAYLCNGK